jgi:hypothetical protein
MDPEMHCPVNRGNGLEPSPRSQQGEQHQMSRASITTPPEPQPLGSAISGAPLLAEKFTGKRLEEAEALSETLGLFVVTVDAAVSDVMTVMRRKGRRAVWEPSRWRVVAQYPAPGRPLNGDLMVLAITRHGERPLDRVLLDTMLRNRFNKITGP